MKILHIDDKVSVACILATYKRYNGMESKDL